MNDEMKREAAIARAAYKIRMMAIAEMVPSPREEEEEQPPGLPALYAPRREENPTGSSEGVVGLSAWSGRSRHRKAGMNYLDEMKREAAMEDYQRLTMAGLPPSGDGRRHRAHRPGQGRRDGRPRHLGRRQGRGVTPGPRALSP
jgi:hypothetical protein